MEISRGSKSFPDLVELSKTGIFGEFPSDLVVRIQCCLCRRVGSIPG